VNFEIIYLLNTFEIYLFFRDLLRISAGSLRQNDTQADCYRSYIKLCPSILLFKRILSSKATNELDPVIISDMVSDIVNILILVEFKVIYLVKRWAYYLHSEPYIYISRCRIFTPFSSADPYILS
jgi:hypothetical protein